MEYVKIHASEIRHFLTETQDGNLNNILAIQKHREKVEPVHDIVVEETDDLYHLLDSLA